MSQRSSASARASRSRRRALIPRYLAKNVAGSGRRRTVRKSRIWMKSRVWPSLRSRTVSTSWRSPGMKRSSPMRSSGPLAMSRMPVASTTRTPGRPSAKRAYQSRTSGVTKPSSVARGDDRALGDGRMLLQNVLHFGAGDLVAAGHDHVVGAALVGEVAVHVHRVDVPGDVPAAPPHVLRLPVRLAPVLAAGRALDGDEPGLARRQLAAGLVDHATVVAADGHAGGARPHAPALRRDEDVEHLRGADAVEQLDAGPLAPLLPGRRRQRLGRRDAEPETAEVVALAHLRDVEHQAVRRRGAEAERHA